MTVQRVSEVVKPALLRWARETAGLTLEQAAKKIGIQAERLTDWEENRLRPTVAQLRKAANVYKRPLAVFFLSQPPAQPTPLHDFRRLPANTPSRLSPELLLEMRRARRRRAVSLELLSDLDRAVPELPLHFGLDDDPEEATARARAWLGVALQEQAQWTGGYEPLNNWLAAFEAHGVLVFQTGDVSLDEMRGFSLNERRLPVIVLNAKDAPRARVFTLMHEFTHLMLSQGGVCDPLRIFISLWQRLDAAIVTGDLVSPDEVLQEVRRREDTLAEALSTRTGLFSPLDDSQMTAVADVIHACPGLVSEEAERGRADPFVVALARVRQGTVVSGERPR